MSGQLPYDPAQEGAQTSFEARMAYGDYLHLDEILGAQKPLTHAHDEMLFIVQHQVSELWMRLAIHEIGAARKAIAGDAVQPAFKMLSRVARIFEQLNNAWDVLRTMTPSEYTHFRGELGQASGLQSWQYRQIEFMVGNRNRAMLRPHTHRPDVLALLERELVAPSLYDEALRFLARNGVAVPRASLERDLSSAYEISDGVRRCVAHCLRSPRNPLASLRTRREAGRFRGLFPPLAIQPRHHRRARHRVQARHRRDQRGQLSQTHAGSRTVPGAVAGADGALKSKMQSG